VRTNRSLLIVALVALLTAACGGTGQSVADVTEVPPNNGTASADTTSGGEGTSSAPTELTTVRLAYGVAAIDPSTAPWLSAPKTAGFWQEEGLNVEVTGFNGAGPALQLLSNGQVDAVFTGTPILYQLRGEGASLKAVASVYDRNHVYPVVPMDSDIETIEDFVGKRLGILDLQGSVALWMKVLLAEHGMTLDDFESVTPVGAGAPAVEAFTGGEIDVLAEWHGHYATLRELFDLEFKAFDDDPALTEYNFVQAFFVTDEMIANSPEIVEGLVRGMAKGVIFADANPEAAAEGHFRQFPATIPTDVDFETAVAQAAAIIKENVQLGIGSAMEGQAGIMHEENVAAVRDALVAAGQLENPLEPDEYFTNEFVERANNFDPAEIVSFAQSFQFDE